MRSFILTIVSSLILATAFGQASKETAIRNFGSFFDDFKKAYPADMNKDSFKDYSELWLRKSIPEELKIMIAYEKDFYNEYLAHIKYSRDTLIKIDSLNFNKEVIEVYGKFRRSILNGSVKGKFNKKQDQAYSEQLRSMVNQENPPLIGYYQTVMVIMEAPDGHKEETIMLITYNKDLEVIDLGKMEK